MEKKEEVIVSTFLDKEKDLQLGFYDEDKDEFTPLDNSEHRKLFLEKTKMTPETLEVLESIVEAIQIRFNVVNAELKDIGRKIL